jgi:DNA polymerase II small subunit/DNA polymerase delta subunit B
VFFETLYSLRGQGIREERYESLFSLNQAEKFKDAILAKISSPPPFLTKEALQVLAVSHENLEDVGELLAQILSLEQTEIVLTKTDHTFSLIHSFIKYVQLGH